MIRLIIIVLCLTFAALPLSSEAYVPFISSDQISSVKLKIQTDPEAKKAFLVLMRQADKAASGAIAVPKGYGGSLNDYICPEHNVPLKYYEKSDIHRCPTDNKQYTGEKLDAAMRYYVHMKNSRSIKDLGLAYALTGDKKYADATREMLTAYAKSWNEYKHPNEAKGHGHLFWQAIDDAQFAINLAWGYNLSYPAFTDEERQLIDKDLLTPLYQTIKAEKNDTADTNQVWLNAGTALLGFAVDDIAWYKPAIEGPFGFSELLDKGVPRTGLWSDGSVVSHYAALSAFAAVAEIGPRFGYNLPDSAKLKQLFAAPLLITPQTSEISKSSAPDLYELAYSWYEDPLYAEHLLTTYSTFKLDRISYRALLYGLPLTAKTITSPVKNEAK